jgi:acetyltransferase-like isoleucine patch superfamily enzyme
MVHSLIRHSEVQPASPFVHPSAIVEDGAVVGNGTRIWHRGHVRAGSHVGCDCTLGFSVYVDTMVTVGDRCKIQNHVSLFRGVVVEDDVFIGPSVVFTNDLYPRAGSIDWDVGTTRVHRGASIGANATVICGVDIGEWAMIAAGAIVTKDVPPHALIVGTPGRRRGWVCRCGLPLGTPATDATRWCTRCGTVPDPGASP